MMGDVKEAAAMTVPKKEQNAGVALLLERMKTNPEEFIGEAGFAYSKWGSLISAYREHLEEEDKAALTDALCKLHQQKFTEKVLEELVDPKKSSLEELITAKRNANPTLLAQQQFQTEMMRSQLDLAKANKLETKNPHKTLFGKLFNYQ